MRRLHATGPRERFVASGTYQQPDGLLEHWSIHDVGHGAWFVRVDRDGRAAGRCSLLQEALRNAEGFFERVDQQLHGPDGRPVSRLRCTRHARSAELSLVDQSGRHETGIDLDPDFLIVPPGSLLSGMALAKAAQMTQPVSLLRVVQAGEQLLWRLCSATVECPASASVAVDGRPLPARACGWSSSAERVWLDRHDVALRLDDGNRCIRLSRYARRHA